MFDQPLPEKLIEKINNDNFYFVQIGANDGISHDPLYKWINKYNWSGIMFEPQKEPFEKLTNLRKKYKNILLINKGISEVSGKYKLYKHNGVGHSIDNFTGGSSLLLRNDSQFNENSYEEINCISFNEAVEKYKIQKIDLLVIDTEGYDFNIINSIDLDLILPKNIWFEYWNHDFDDRNNPNSPTSFNQNKEIIEKMESFGYNLYNYGENMLLSLLGDL